jgi:hypothetical protein
MEERSHQYRLQLDYLTDTKGEKQQTEPVQIEFENHDNILSIIEILKEKDPFENKDQAVEFAIGLKMFGEVMIRNRNNPLFEELMPAFGIFMKKLKSL